MWHRFSLTIGLNEIFHTDKILEIKSRILLCSAWIQFGERYKKGTRFHKN